NLLCISLSIGRISNGISELFYEFILYILCFMKWEMVRLEAEARLSTSNSILLSKNDLMENTKEPIDLFLKRWSMKVGKAFRENSNIMKRTNSNNSSSENTINLDNHTTDP
ncbi:hypothetical protein, partial [Paludifilum halophilum]